MTMNSKLLKPNNGTNYGKLSNIVKDNACQQKATFSLSKICIASHPNSEIKAISDHKTHVSKTWSKTVLFTK